MPLPLIRSYEDLLVWQRSMELTDAVYELVPTLPRDERFELCSQLRRAAVSIACNIAEGHGRRRRGAFGQHLSIARGSAMEVETLLKIVQRRGLGEPNTLATCVLLVDEVGRMLSALSHRVEQARDPSTSW